MNGVIGAVGAPERSFALVLGALAGVAIAFWSTTASMVAVWNSSNTYSHGFFVVPAFLWLVWRRRGSLAMLPLRPSWWALAAVAVIGVAWLVSRWMAIDLPNQVAMVAMVPAVIAVVFGIGWVRALLFPLAFLFFAVPFGESLVPVLMDWTADFTVAALKLSGVPVYRDGLHFEIPSGRWSVVDSCSGIRYMFACAAVASLYSWTIYRGTLRRLLFIAFAIGIAVVANWIRAYGIVMLGHLSNNEIAAGADHLVYGGVFFTVVVTLMFALGAVWREDTSAPADAGAERGPAGHSAPAAAGAAGPFAAAAATAAIAMTMLWLAAPAGLPGAADGATSAIPVATPRAGWQPVDSPLVSWRPVLWNPVSVASQSFAKGDQVISLHIGVFGRSTAGSKLTSAMNRFVERDGLNPQWRLAQLGKAEVRWGDQPLEVHTATLLGHEVRVIAWQWYWVDGVVTGDPVHASVLQLLSRLRGRSEMSAWVSAYTVVDGDPSVGRNLLEAFVSDMSSSIDSALELSATAHVQAATRF